MPKFIMSAMLLVLLASCSEGNPSQTEASPPATPITKSPAQETQQKAVAKLQPTAGNKAAGTIAFTQAGDSTSIKVDVTGLTPGKHGFHIHEKGDCRSKDAKSAGNHFNPTKQPHGAPTVAKRHVGDLGNLTADSTGKATTQLQDSVLRLSGDQSLVGRSVIIHSKADDLKSQPSGDAGERVACGVIQTTKS
jgi:Cu-Zn family superoxide dismutase